MIVKAAKDPVQPPQDPVYTNILQRCLCRCTIGADCYIVEGMTGDIRTVPYGATVEQWTEVCEELLELAVSSELVE